MQLTLVVCVRFCLNKLSIYTKLSAKLTHTTCYRPFLFVLLSTN